MLSLYSLSFAHQSDGRKLDVGGEFVYPEALKEERRARSQVLFIIMRTDLGALKALAELGSFSLNPLQRNGPSFLHVQLHGT